MASTVATDAILGGSSPHPLFPTMVATAVKSDWHCCSRWLGAKLPTFSELSKLLLWSQQKPLSYIIVAKAISKLLAFVMTCRFHSVVTTVAFVVVGSGVLVMVILIAVEAIIIVVQKFKENIYINNNNNNNKH